jgi:hypothetical protein
MYYESNAPDREGALRFGGPISEETLAWYAALDTSLQVLRQAVDELESGDPSRDRQELVVHLSHSIHAIREMLNSPQRFTEPSLDVQALRRAS